MVDWDGYGGVRGPYKFPISWYCYFCPIFFRLQVQLKPWKTCIIPIWKTWISSNWVNSHFVFQAIVAPMQITYFFLCISSRNWCMGLANFGADLKVETTHGINVSSIKPYFPQNCKNRPWNRSDDHLYVTINLYKITTDLMPQNFILGRWNQHDWQICIWIEALWCSRKSKCFKIVLHSGKRVQTSANGAHLMQAWVEAISTCIFSVCWACYA